MSTTAAQCDSPLSDLLAEEAALSHRILAVRTGRTDEALPAEVYLRVLTLRAAITHALSWGCQTDIWEALEAGATWEQIAAARAMPVAQARAEFRRWIDAQAALWDAGPTTTGLAEPPHPRPLPPDPPQPPMTRRPPPRVTRDRDRRERRSWGELVEANLPLTPDPPGGLLEAATEAHTSP